MSVEPVNINSRRARLTGRLAAIEWATSLQTGNPTAKSVLKAMAWYVGERNTDCWPSQRRLVLDTDLSVRSVQNAIALLVEVGLIEVQTRQTDAGRTTSNIYTLRLDRVASPEDFASAKSRMKSGVQEVHPQNPGAEGRVQEVHPQICGGAGGACRGCSTCRGGVQEVHPQKEQEKEQEKEPVSKAPTDVVASEGPLFDLEEPPAPPEPDRFEEFWSTYLRKGNKKSTRSQWQSALKKKGVTADLLIERAAVYVDATRRLQESKGELEWKQFLKDGQRWLKWECWEDEPPAAPQNYNPLAHSMSVEQLVQERGY